MKKNITKIITRFTITILISIVLLSATFNQQTFANENEPKLEFWFEVGGKQVLSYQDFMDAITQDYDYTWEDEIDLILVDIKVKSLTGASERLSVIDFDIEYNDHILHIDRVNSSHRILTNPASPTRWDVPTINPNNNKVYFVWKGLTGLDPLNEYVPTNGVLIGTIGLKLDLANIPSDFLIEPVLNLNGNHQDIGDLAYIDDNSVQRKYYNSDFVFKPLQVGDPDAGPDASLSSLSVDGATQNYLNISGETLETSLSHQVTISYADSINGTLTFNPVAKKSSATIEIKDTKPLYATGDIVTIEVTDDTETKSYQVEITVTDPNNDTNVTFTPNKTIKSGNFSGINNDIYNIVVDFNTLELQVTANVHALSNVNPTVLNFTSLQAGATQTKQVTVTAENGADKTYTVNVTREIGNSDTSFEVKINNIDITKSGNTYYQTLAETVDRFAFKIGEFETTTKVYYRLGTYAGLNVADYTILPLNGTISNILVSKGNKVIYTILAVAQDGSKEQSFIEVDRSPSTNVDLQKVTIYEITGGTTHTQDLTRINSTYTYTVKDNTSDRVTFTATGIAGENQLIEIFDQNNINVSEIPTQNLSVGDNNFTVRVTAQDGTSQRIFSLVIKKLSSEKEVVKIELINTETGQTLALGVGANGFTFDPATRRYSYTLAYADATNYELVLTSSEKSTIFVGAAQSPSNSRVFSDSFSAITIQNREYTNITIKAENGTVSEPFSIRITRAAAQTDNKLDDIQINGVTVNGFLPSKGDYSLTIFDRGTSSVFIEGILPSNSKATIQFYVNGILVPGSDGINVDFIGTNVMNVELRVRSESGVVFIYRIPVVAASNDSSIQNIEIFNAVTNELLFNTFSPATFDYTNITFPYNVSTIKMVVTTTDSQATVMGIVSNGTYVLNTTTPLQLTVFGKSEVGNESSQKYEFRIRRETPRSYKDLETLTIKYTDANSLEVTEVLDVDNANNFTLRVDNFVTPIQITASILGLQGERIIGSSNNVLVLNEIFSPSQKNRTVTITVEDEGGLQKTYTITIVRANNVKVFDTVTIGSRTYGLDEFDSNNKLTLDDVLFAVDRLNVSFNMVPNSNSTIISPVSFIGNNLDGIWFFNLQTGIITATFQVRSEYGELSPVYTISINREPASSQKTLNSIKIVNGSTVFLDESGEISGDFDIRVNRDINTVLITTTLPIIDRSIVMTPYQVQSDSNGNRVYTYTLTLNNPNANAATIHQITVKAEDGSTKIHTITIWRRNSNIEFDELTVKQGDTILHSGTFESAYTFLANFDFNVAELTFIIRPKDIHSRITINNGQRLIPVDGIITTTIPLVVGLNREINLKIESDILFDDLASEYKTKTYKFTYNKQAASNVAELGSLQAVISGNNILDGFVFDFENENEFGDFRVNRNISSVTIHATALEGGTITGIGSRILSVGRNQLLITVTSQSGTYSKDYVLIIYRNNDNAQINNIAVTGQTLVYDASTYNYDLGTVTYDVDKLNFNITLSDALYAKYYINGIQSANQINLNYGLNEIRVQAESEYGTKGQIYTITVFRQTPYTDTTLNGLTVYFDSNLTNRVTYIPSTFTYTIDLNPHETPATFRIIAELKNVDKQSISSATNLDSDIQIIYQSGEINQTIKFTVYAENNVQQEYTIIIKKGNVLSNDYSINDVIMTSSASVSNYVNFDAVQLEYNFSVDYAINLLNLEVLINDSNATITYVKRPSNLIVGVNMYEFYVTAQNGEVGPTYKINVTRNQPSTDNSLAGLSIADPLNPGTYLLGLAASNPQVVFDGKQTYTITLNEAYLNQIITILFTKNVSAQVVTGDVNRQLIIDQKQKRFEVNVKPEDPNGITKAYFINVEIKYENNSLTGISIENQVKDMSSPVISHVTLANSVNIQPTLANSYGRIVIKDSLGQVVSGNTLNLNFGINEYTIEVYSETDVLVETHDIEVIREKHSDKDIIGVTLNGSDGINYLTNFNEGQYIYNIEVPTNVNSVTLAATISPKAVLTGGGSFSINLDETKIITFYVTAENGDTTDVYTINVTKRSLSTDNKLSEIRFRDPLNNTYFIMGLEDKNPSTVFNPNVTNYTIQLGLEYIDKQVTLRYELSNPYQTVQGIMNGQAIKLVRGDNIFKITVYPEDIHNEDPTIYTVNIVVKNIENSLESLEIDSELIDLDPSKPIEFVTEKSAVDINFDTLNKDGNVTLKNAAGQVVSAPLSLALGDNIFKIEIANEFGDIVESYDLIIERLHSSDNEIIDATLKDNLLTQYLVFNETQLNYFIEVPFIVNSVDLELFIHPKATAYIMGIQSINNQASFGLTSGEVKVISFYVVAENGVVGQTYTISITRLRNTDDKLQNLNIQTNVGILLNTQSFDPSLDYYAFTVNELHTHATFSLIINPGQTITGIMLDQALPLQHGLNRFEIHVQPEDLTLDAFVIVVEITVVNSNIDLLALLINSDDIYQNGQDTYVLDDVSSDVKILEITALISDLNGSIRINGVLNDTQLVNLVPGQNIIEVEILSEDQSMMKTYTIYITQNLEQIDILDLLTVQTNLHDYLLGNSIDNPVIVFDPLQNVYKFEVNESIETIFVDFVLASNKQSIVGPINEHLVITHGVNRFEFTVIPEDPSKPNRIYVIEVTQKNDDIIVNQLFTNGKNIYEPGIFDYTINSVTNDIQSIKVIPVIDNYSSYRIYDTKNNLVPAHDVTLQFGMNNIRVVVTSESGLTTQTFNIQIEQTYSSNNEIIDVRFFDASNNVNRLNFDPEILLYNIEFPATTNIARLRVETNDKASVFINGVQEINTRRDFALQAGQTITATFYVVAEDGTRGALYTVNVYKRLITDPVLSDNTNLVDVTIEIPINQLPFDFDANIYEYTINIPYMYDEIYIKAHTEHRAATVANEGAYALTPGESKVIRFRVIAEDGTIALREYKFTIIRDLPNTDTTLRSLSVEDLNGNELAFDQIVFDPSNRIYNITLPDTVKLNKVNVLAEKNHHTQILYNTGVVNLHGEIEGFYNTIITITVVAEDGSTGEYIIYVLHDLDFASIAEVKDITVIGDNGTSYFGLEFSDNIQMYDGILVPFNVNSTRLIVQTIGNIIYYDHEGNIIEDNRIQYFGSSNQVTYRFRIESTNGQNQSPIYTIIINRETPDKNSLLSTLQINGEKILGFDPNIYQYNYIHPLQFEDFIDVYGVSQSAKSIVRGNDMYTLLAGQTRTISIEVTAESGDVSVYQIHVSYVNSNALLGELTVYEIKGDLEIENSIPLRDDILDYIIIIGKDTVFVNIKGYAKDQGGASIRGFGIREVGIEDHTAEIIVTSGDGLEEITYKITLRRDNSLSDLKEITLLTINDSRMDLNNSDSSFVYRYNLSNGTNTVKLSAVTNTQAKISINGSEFSSTNTHEIILTDVNESKVIRIDVLAEDGSIQQYMVVIDKDIQPSLLLTILLILSIVLWFITSMVFILKRIRKNKRKDKNQIIF